MLLYTKKDEIISTNIDHALEDALAQVEMKPDRDYEIMSIAGNHLQDQKSCFCRITKVFGDFLSRNYTVRERSSHLENAEVKSFLQDLLGKDLLIVGFDPIWDQDILRLIPVTTNRSLWLISEENEIAAQSPDLAGLLQRRSSVCILGSQGSYDSFIPKVHYYLDRNNLLDSQHQQLAAMQMQLSTIQEELTRLKTTLDKLQKDQKEKSPPFNEAFHEIQEIQGKLEEFSGDREQHLQD